MRRTIIPTATLLLAIVLAAALAACRIQPQQPSEPFDCATIPEAERRFPEQCAEVVDEDAGVDAAMP